VLPSRRRVAKPGPAIARELTLARRATVERKTKETDIRVSVDLDATGPVRHRHRHRLLRPHARAARASTAASRSSSTCQGDLHVDEHHTVEDCALALGEALRRRSATSAASRATASCCRWTRRARRSPSTCRAAPTRCSRASSAATQVGGLPSELVPHFFRSLADSLGAAVHVRSGREHAPHGRGLLQGHRPRAAPGRAHRRHELPSSKGVLLTLPCAALRGPDRHDRRRHHRLGGANLASLRFALERLGADASSAPIRRPSRGAARAAARRRRGRRRHAAAARARARERASRTLRQPVLGICLGMQLLFAAFSEEGDTACLGILPGHATRCGRRPFPVPHMGWNQLEPLRATPLLAASGGRDICTSCTATRRPSLADGPWASPTTAAEFSAPPSAAATSAACSSIPSAPARAAGCSPTSWS
jgi:imidazoleglycerol phosphate dehydratase HisB